MPEEKMYSVHDLSGILDVGKATINVWRIWFNQWLNSSGSGIYTVYPEKDLETFMFISQCNSQEYDVEEIKESLTERSEQLRKTKNSTISEQSVDFSPLQQMFEPLLKDLIHKQEKLVQVEEKKVSALEKRADAEILKAEALNKIAGAIMNTGFNETTLSGIQENLKLEHTQKPGNSEMEDTPFPEQPHHTYEKNHEEKAGIDDSIIITDTDDLSHLIDSIQNDPDEPIDDLSTLLDHSSQDLSVENVKPEKTDNYQDIEDLSVLLEPSDELDNSQTETLDKDDLSGSDADGTKVDDLSSLLEPEPETTESIDNLSLLIDSETGTSEKVDNLSLLLDDDKIDTDDLSLLLDDATSSSTDQQEQELSKPSNTVDPLKNEEDKPFEEYKAAVLSRIIILKEKEGYTAEETCRYFNDQKIKTLTKKESWDLKTMTDVYSYVDSIRKSRKS